MNVKNVNKDYFVLTFSAKKSVKHRKVRKPGKFNLYVIQNCGYSKCAESLPKHDCAITFKIIIFFACNICEKPGKYILNQNILVGTLTVRN